LSHSRTYFYLGGQSVKSFEPGSAAKVAQKGDLFDADAPKRS
jgi:hypothetical protein